MNNNMLHNLLLLQKIKHNVKPRIKSCTFQNSLLFVLIYDFVSGVILALDFLTFFSWYHLFHLLATESEAFLGA